MMEAGFVQLDARGRPQQSWQPPKDWATRYPDEWVFLYSLPGAALRFRLHCSLQAQTRRMFIHASEIDSQDMPLKDNIQVMGLQLDNYVPDPARLRTRSWEGLVANEHTLADMAGEFVIQPLWRQAERLPEGTTNGATHGGGGGLSARLAETARSLADPAVALPAAVVACGVAAALLLYWQRHQLQSLARASRGAL
eukprot:scaffold4.g4671.t1